MAWVWVVGLVVLLVFCFSKIDNVHLQTSHLFAVGRHPACGQNADLESRRLEYSFCCCAQSSTAKFVLIILSWTEGKFEQRSRTVA